MARHRVGGGPNSTRQSCGIRPTHLARRATPEPGATSGRLSSETRPAPAVGARRRLIFHLDAAVRARDAPTHPTERNATNDANPARTRLARPPAVCDTHALEWPAGSTAPPRHPAPRCRASATPTPIRSPGDLARRSAGLVKKRAVHERAFGPS